MFGMAAGLAKSGLIPFVSTMAVFSTMRAAEQVRTDICYQNLDVNNQQLFTAKLSDFRATYQFNQRQFLRLILVYSDIERNQQNYTFDVDASSKGLGTQLLYSYKINPLTKFFVGYSDSAYQDDVLTSLTKHERSVFIKFSYNGL